MTKSRYRAMHITEKGHQVVFIQSLDELKGYSLKDIEIPVIKGRIGNPISGFKEITIHETNDKMIFLEKDPNDVYRLDEVSYKSLRHSYLEFAGKDPNIDSLIETIDSRLKEIEQ